MIAVWRTLLWKEWREQRAALLILTAFFVIVPAVFSLRTPTNYFGALSITFFAIPLVSMFVAMNIAAGEQSSRTIGFLQALPVSRRKAAAAKLLLAMIAVVGPVCVAVGVAALVQLAIGHSASEAMLQDSRVMFGREGGDWLVTRLVVPSLVAVSFLLWIAAPGVNRSDEVRAGAVGLLVTVAYWAGVGLVGYVLVWAGSRDATIVWVLIAIGAGGIASFAQVETRWALYGGLAVVAHLALAAWFVIRFGRVAPGCAQAIEPVRAMQPTTWLAPPRRSPMSAIAWKQVRESLPLAAMGAGCIAAIGLFICFAARREGNDETSQLLLMGTAVTWLLVGMMVATVAGIGVFMEDLSPGLHSFWRSRPIKLGQWFVVKYLTGFAITFVTLAIPLLAVSVYVFIRGELPESAGGREIMSEARTFVVGAALAQWALYNWALAAIALLRRPIHAAFGALAATAVAFAAGSLVADEITRVAPGIHDGLELAMWALSIAFASGAAALAWFAVRNDWGWKR